MRAAAVGSHLARDATEDRDALTVLDDALSKAVGTVLRKTEGGEEGFQIGIRSGIGLGLGMPAFLAAHDVRWPKHVVTSAATRGVARGGWRMQRMSLRNEVDRPNIA